jgi:hypothetical protein
MLKGSTATFFTVPPVAAAAREERQAVKNVKTMINVTIHLEIFMVGDAPFGRSRKPSGTSLRQEMTDDRRGRFARKLRISDSLWFENGKIHGHAQTGCSTTPPGNINEGKDHDKILGGSNNFFC